MAVWRRKSPHRDSYIIPTPREYTTRPSLSENVSRRRWASHRRRWEGRVCAVERSLAEFFDLTAKAELVSGMEFPSRQAAKTAIFDYLEAFYNTRRLHSLLWATEALQIYEEGRMKEASVA